MFNILRLFYHSFFKIKKKIFRRVNFLLIRFFVKNEKISLLCLLIKYNLKKIKGIKPKKSKKLSVIVLSKSGGIDDLICSQQKYNKDIEFFILNRFLVMQIYMAIFDIKDEKNSKMYFLKEPRVLKEKYLKFLITFLNEFNNKYKFNAFIGFNFNYLAEKDFQSACSQLKIPFLLLYKEGVVTELEKFFFTHVLKKKKEKFNGFKVAVYSEDTKKYLVDSKFVSKNKVEVVGCSRLSQSYDYKKIKPDDQILYYAIQNDRGLPNRFIRQYGSKFFKDLKLMNLYNSKFNWIELHYKTLKFLKKFALRNPKVSIVIKIKTGALDDMGQYENLPNNIKLQFDGTGHQLLEKSKVVIGWNTSSIFEGIAANRFILLPYFHEKKNFFKKRSELVLKLKNENYAYSENDFYEKLNSFIKKKYNKNQVYNNHYSLKHYLGNADNNANMRLNNFLKKNISN